MDEVIMFVRNPKTYKKKTYQTDTETIPTKDARCDDNTSLHGCRVRVCATQPNARVALVHSRYKPKTDQKHAKNISEHSKTHTQTTETHAFLTRKVRCGGGLAALGGDDPRCRKHCDFETKTDEKSVEGANWVPIGCQLG